MNHIISWLYNNFKKFFQRIRRSSKPFSNDSTLEELSQDRAFIGIVVIVVLAVIIAFLYSF